MPAAFAHVDSADVASPACRQTKIDVVIVLTTLSLALTGMASLALARFHTEQSRENMWLGSGTWHAKLT